MELTLGAGCWIKFCKWLAKGYAPITITICLSPFLWIGTMVDSFYSSGNFSFQIEVISLWIFKQIVLPPALISSAGIILYIYILMDLKLNNESKLCGMFHKTNKFVVNCGDLLSNFVAPWAGRMGLVRSLIGAESGREVWRGWQGCQNWLSVHCF